MNYIRSYYFVLILALWFGSGCDSTTPSSNWVNPTIQIQFVEPALIAGDAKLDDLIGRLPGSNKTNTIWDVTLTVRSVAGTDYSPPSITVDDANTDAAIFDVTLPADSLYRFEVTYAQAGTRVAQGTAIYQVDRETSDVTIPVVIQNGSIPMVGFEPSIIRAKASDVAQTVLTLRYYGTETPIAGLACRFRIEGIRPNQLEVSGPDLVQTDEQTVGVAWRWADTVTGQVDLATIQIPNQVGQFCITATAGEIRTVTPNGDISPLQATEACVEILP